jgi:hypothetical protein
MEDDLQLGLSFSGAPQKEPLPLTKHIASISLESWLLSPGGNYIKWSVTKQLGPAGVLEPRGRLARSSDRNRIGLSTPEWSFHDVDIFGCGIDTCEKMMVTELSNSLGPYASAGRWLGYTSYARRRVQIIRIA